VIAAALVLVALAAAGAQHLKFTANYRVYFSADNPLTSVVLVAGFLVLATSSFEVNAGMGLLTALVIALALAADFFLLPPLLMRIEESDDEKVDLADPAPGPASA
jgi:predicted RND superfamily exporter protein